ncbi:hypothetical protein I6L73_11770 [Klebsiella quasipneumoniae]|uniref:hypothetical protein n=1 Tax=Klebsiella quasipneumoniae TaxID=1463165 RepID=UPI00109C2E78|nr:hypothetical protein [Klebsiella quasipneumoniae]QXA85917.1 hypothetical protein I6L73_11770 [Klebsiella quasipneumoniae]UDC11277.1 hypothetical protein LGM28_13180 [Klebsiella quasipneumoniae subsp. similipneumoniae]VGP20610.1 hypothetical protein SB04697_02604 [Klebsiella quasipneumoniae subsp. similipneumoniae]
MTDITDLAQLRAELSNPANGSKDHLRKLALLLVEALERKEEQCANWFQMAQKLGEDLDAAEKRIAELESRTVKLPAERFCPADYAGSQLWSETEVWNQAISACNCALRTAGFKVEAE